MKGAGTIVYDGGDYFVNTTGNVGMATAGSGDVLTGIIASFAAQGISAIDAAICGVYVHGLAGDRACLLYTSFQHHSLNQRNCKDILNSSIAEVLCILSVSYTHLSFI